MACPKCASGAVRIAEPGLAANTLFCMKCSHSFRRTSPGIKGVAAHSIILMLPALVTAILHGDFDDLS